MPLVLTSIAIDAPTDKVWDVLTDLSSYAEWNPVILAPRGELRPGGSIKFTIRVGRIKAPIGARVVRADGTELRWEGPPNPIGNGSHFFRLEPLEGNTPRTRLVHGEQFTGPVFSLPWRWLGPQLQKDYDLLNRSLKARAEA